MPTRPHTPPLDSMAEKQMRVRISEMVKALRLKHEETQEELAATLGVPRKYIIEVENMGRKVPVNFLYALAKYWDVPMETICAGSPKDVR
jgi:transcriptional regulator with XRE-family HTH domain